MSLSSKTNNNIKAKANTKANVDVDDEWSSFITGVCDDDSDDVECNINYDMLAKYDIKNDMILLKYMDKHQIEILDRIRVYH